MSLRNVFTVAALVGAGLLAAEGTDALGKPGNGGNGGNGQAKGRPTKARVDLVVPEAGADLDAKGRIDVRFFPERGKRSERSWLRFKLRKLDPLTEYTLWADDPLTPEDPTLQQIGTAGHLTDEDGAMNVRLDTKHGDALPFGATLAELSEMAVEVRDGAGAAVLSGNLPAVQ